MGQRVRRVWDCSSRSQSGGDHRRFDYLGVGGACLARVTAVDINAILALSSESYGDGNQLFVLYRDGSIGDRRPVEGPKGLYHLRRDVVHLLQLGQVFFVVHTVVY